MRVFKRGKSWYVDYRVNGTRIMKSFGRQKATAELYAKDLDLKEVRGELGVILEKIDVGSFIGKYVEFSKYNKSSWTVKSDLPRLKRFQNFLKEKGIVKLDLITPNLMEEFKGQVLQVATPRTYNHYLELIKAMLNKAVEWRYLRNNPLANCKLLKDSSVRQIRYLTTEEIKAVLDEAKPFMKKAIKIFLYTGLRRSELVYLQWPDVDYRNRLITIQSKPEQGFHPKSYKPRSIPMSPALYQLLLDLPQKGLYVFDNGNRQPKHHEGYYYRELMKIYRRVGIRNANLHTLRHTFASHLVMSGTDLRTVQQLMGHSTIQVTERYAHLSPGHLAKAVESLDFETAMETKRKQKSISENSPIAPQ